MEPVDILIENGTILTMDEEGTILEPGFLMVEGDRISRMGGGCPEPVEAKRHLDAKGGLVLPGLINGHTHAAMSLFRGLADDLPLMDWLNHYIFPVERHMDGDFVHTGTLLACAEMILSGTTTFCDMYLFEGDAARAAGQAGMRCILGEVLYDFPSPNYGDLEKGLAYTENLILEWARDPLVSIAVEPHSLFTCSPDLLVRAHELAQRHDVPLILHLSETTTEVNEIIDKYGKKPLEHLRSLGILGPRLIADHCVHLDDEEVDMLAGHGVRVIHNPESNMKLASGVAPVPDMIARGIAVGLGTDGCASNNNLDLFTEMDTAAKLHKVHRMDTTVMDAYTVLRMATIEGARALGLDNLIGSLEAGKKADIIVVDTQRPHLTPMYHPYSHLVYAARGQDVTYSIIDGRVVMENRRILTLDLEEILARARKRSEDVISWIRS
ncbi:MAG: amidohydrolase [Deltaproteobacteria bacterium]|nr:amidohydrolase [Deltaproteobacteria bacterium]MBW1950293.1 amidohydrolase [Deltaproteobacteria bacterium]